MSGLPRRLHWLQGWLLISGAFFVVLYQSGWALAEIGTWSLLIWLAVALLGALQARWLYDLARAFPHKAGGTAVYAQEMFRGRARVLAFLSGWGYWLAWTPATVLNSYIAAQLLITALGSTLDPVPLTLLLMTFLYTLNWLGLGRMVQSAYAMAVFSFGPLLLLVWLSSQTLTPERIQRLFHLGVAVDGWDWVKWFFVLAWTGYGLEMISSVVAETRGSPKPMFMWAGAWSLTAFAGIPLLLALLTDWSTLQDDPFKALKPLFVVYLGEQGTFSLLLFLVAALLYSALGILVPSTRTFYQMARDGLLPPFFASLNRFGTPVGSLVMDIILNVALLLLFGSGLVSILAVANVGYMFVFVVLPWVYGIFLHRRARLHWHTALLLLTVSLFNAGVLVWGSWSWGGLVFWVGWLLLGLGAVLYYRFDRASARAHPRQT